MFELKNNEKDLRLKCEIVGYQSPDDYDYNWCLVKIEVKQGGQVFEVVDASLQATDLVELYEWFQCLSENRLPKYAHLNFHEPCISFEFRTSTIGSVEISILLNCELKPDFDMNRSELEESDWNIPFKLSEQDFEETLEGIKATIKRYPGRE